MSWHKIVSGSLGSVICVVASCDWILSASQLWSFFPIDTVTEIAETQLQIPRLSVFCLFLTLADSSGFPTLFINYTLKKNPKYYEALPCLWNPAYWIFCLECQARLIILITAGLIHSSHTVEKALLTFRLSYSWSWEVQMAEVAFRGHLCL